MEHSRNLRDAESRVNPLCRLAQAFLRAFAQVSRRALPVALRWTGASALPAALALRSIIVAVRDVMVPTSAGVAARPLSAMPIIICQLAIACAWTA